MTLLERIGMAVLGIGALAYTACATPQIREGVAVGAEQPVQETPGESDNYGKVSSNLIKLVGDTYRTGEVFEGNFSEEYLYGEVRNPKSCIKIKEYETQQGSFAVVAPQIPQSLQNIMLLELYTEDPATEFVIEQLRGLAWLTWKHDCHGLLPQGRGYALVLDEDTILIPEKDNEEKVALRRHYSWESATARERKRTGGPMDDGYYPITPELVSLLAEAVAGIKREAE